MRTLITLGAAIGVGATAIYLSLFRTSTVKPNLEQSKDKSKPRGEFFGIPEQDPLKKSQIIKPEIHSQVSSGCMK